ncbi:hypothetical protein [uncultured Sphingomonas sp.]
MAEAESYNPDKLLERYAEQQAGIQSLRDRLKVVLADALTERAPERIDA